MRPGTCKRCQRGDEVWRNNRRGSALFLDSPMVALAQGGNESMNGGRWPVTFPQWTPATVQVA